jgi:hypothetical protein
MVRSTKSPMPRNADVVVLACETLMIERGCIHTSRQHCECGSAVTAVQCGMLYASSLWASFHTRACRRHNAAARDGFFMSDPPRGDAVSSDAGRVACHD